MRNFGGGIGHLNNTHPRSGPLGPNSDEVAVDEAEEDVGVDVSHSNGTC